MKTEDHKQDSDSLEKSEIMKKVLADLEKVELVFSIDDAEFKAKRIDGRLMLHLSTRDQ